jgi:hypothetical protein
MDVHYFRRRFERYYHLGCVTNNAIGLFLFTKFLAGLLFLLSFFYLKEWIKKWQP